MMTVPRFADAVLPHGTTTVVTDAHEIANVLGLAGIDYVLDSARATPLAEVAEGMRRRMDATRELVSLFLDGDGDDEDDDA